MTDPGHDPRPSARPKWRSSSPGSELTRRPGLCCCPPDLPTVSARAALAQTQTELGYDFAAVEVYRTHDVGPAVSGIGALRIERRLRH
jgi:hypothetical protein